ncbi:hypothetical protein DBR43_04355 [Pedobacter sp. KBW06]|uniref:DUF4998 domain-containing protein n=1 Tax=Pedobacter sp. KBW06 TaxID=2153359 RepID=UPI000F5A55D7|nr:DUF4998 domain-containing protein [Pedobacter sp. KBW06]RQO74625.1 hypothetical protein DBR43_04355 [Pedobacter sp. KBW06]
MKYINLLLLAVVLVSCSKMGDPIAEYVKSGELIYATRVDSLKVIGGRERIRLTWILPPNKTAVKTIIQWNAGRNTKEIILPASANGLYEGLLEPMAEGSYLFKVFTEDRIGNKSVSLTLAGSAYGSNYQNSILNRNIISTLINKDSVLINWGSAERGNVATALTYTDVEGIAHRVLVKSTELKSVVKRVKKGSYLALEGLYLPEALSTDTFRVAKKDLLLVDP